MLDYLIFQITVIKKMEDAIDIIELRDNMDYKVIVSQDASAASYREKVPMNT